MPTKHRMLFLHGQYTCPRFYQEKLLKPFLDTLQEDWEVIFLESPRRCQVEAVPSMVTDLIPDAKLEELREWINSETVEGGGDYDKRYDGLDETMEFLQTYLNAQARFDVIAGHSNGALMASILSFYIQQNGWLPQDKHCKAILCMNAPNSYETEVTLGPLFKQHGPVTSMPSLHVLAENDHCFEGSQRLLQVHHPNVKTLKHTSGHFFPTDQAFYDTLRKELNAMVEATASK